MGLTLQITLGTTLLIYCSLVHVALMAYCMPRFAELNTALESRPTAIRTAAILSFGLFAIVFAHTVEIWSWALAFYLVGAFETFETSFYFATVTYTTVGYGDVLLGPDLRVFGAFASITGLLTFGISTALLIGIVVRLLPEAGAHNGDNG